MAVARLGKAGVLAPCVDADGACTYVPTGFLSPKCKLWLATPHLVYPFKHQL
jgi:hypothetical protein